MTVRNLGYLAFKNSESWMEPMKGQRWTSLVKKQRARFEEAVKPVEWLAKTMAYELSSGVSHLEPFESDDVLVEMRGTLHYVWQFKDEKEERDCADLDTAPGEKVWYVEDTSDGGEIYTLKFQTGNKNVWTYTKPVAPYVAVLGDKCYCLESEKSLWYRRLVCLNAKTGKDREVLLEIDDPRWNLALIKGQNGCLFILGNNAGEERLWTVSRKGALQELTGDFDNFVPVGYSNHTKAPIFFGSRRGATFQLIGYQEPFNGIEFKTNIPQFYSPDHHTLITRCYGKRTRWSLIGRTEKKEEIVGDFEIDPFALWKKGAIRICVSKPGYPRYMLGDTICPYAKSSYSLEKSADGTNVPYIVISSCKKVKGLLCVVYGAYGLDTHMNVDRWKPLLDRGWAVCLCLVRGGGDHDGVWAEAARRENKVKSVEDFEACVLGAQRRLRVSPAKTVVYGRSAGGYLIGACLTRHVGGDLFGAVYTEVPYVDVLNTTSNHSLPLTELEFNEFGDPSRRIENAATLISLSPVDALPDGGAPSIFVLDRTAEHDKEVFAYESMKWIVRLQELDQGQKNSQPKLLAITDGEGHFVTGSSAQKERGEDMALLHTWLRKKSNVGIYEMANRKNRKETRKNRKTNRKTRKTNRRSNRK